MNIKTTALLAVLAAAHLPATGWSRPISYPGGTTVMVGRDAMADMVHADYTLTKDWAVGWASTFDRDDDTSTHGPQITRGWRWNYPDSQANLYVSGGAGPARVDDRLRASAWGGASLDWEDRRWYTQAGASAQAIEGGPDRFRQSARVGVAPYVAEAGDLHSWIMLQLDHTPGARSRWTATPLLRQFYGDYLWEAGVSTRGDVLLNLTKTF